MIEGGMHRRYRNWDYQVVNSISGFGAKSEDDDGEKATTNAPSRWWLGACTQGLWATAFTAPLHHASTLQSNISYMLVGVAPYQCSGTEANPLDTQFVE